MTGTDAFASVATKSAIESAGFRDLDLSLQLISCAQRHSCSLQGSPKVGTIYLFLPSLL